jgi:hypothetical protein
VTVYITLFMKHTCIFDTFHSRVWNRLRMDIRYSNVHYKNSDITQQWGSVTCIVLLLYKNQLLLTFHSLYRQSGVLLWPHSYKHHTITSLRKCRHNVIWFRTHRCSKHTEEESWPTAVHRTLKQWRHILSTPNYKEARKKQNSALCSGVLDVCRNVLRSVWLSSKIRKGVFKT